MVFELCTESLEGCVAARDGGADRMELCRELRVGGLTPAVEMIEQAVALGGPAVHVLVRPHARGFVYAAQEFALMGEGMDAARERGADGVVVGVLLEDGRVDVRRTRELVERAGAMEVTFHRAFDEVRDLDAGLEDVIAAGCARILTSGGEPDVLRGAQALRRLQERAEGRIAIAAGGGLRLGNAGEVARRSGVAQFHASLREVEEGMEDLAARVRVVMLLLRDG
jgi:copper homeostasis protein